MFPKTRIVVCIHGTPTYHSAQQITCIRLKYFACPFQFSDSRVITFSEEWYSIQAENVEPNEINCIMRGFIIFTFYCHDQIKEGVMCGTLITQRNAMNEYNEKLKR